MKKAISLTISISLIVSMVFMVFESPGAKAESDEINVSVTVTAGISIDTPADVTLLPNIAGLTGGTATGDSTWVIKTNNATGFSMAVKASTTPALATAGYNFADYTEADTGTPDFTWSITNTASEFGYSVVAGTLEDEVQVFLDDGVDCGTGSANNADSCWYPLATPDYTIINRSAKTAFAGESEEIRFQAQAGSQAMQDSGIYNAIITVTATMN